MSQNYTINLIDSYIFQSIKYILDIIFSQKKKIAQRTQKLIIFIIIFLEKAKLVRL